MFCTNCGTANRDDAKFCVKCGETLGDIQGEVKPSAAKVLKDDFSKKGAGFLKALFDFSFTEFVTSKIIKLLYGLTIFFAGITALIIIMIGFSAHAGVGIVALLIVAPLIFLISVIYGRVLLEIIIVIFRIAEHLAEMAQQGKIEKKHPDE
ncbi:MAG: DUF4282 domain-containing protein [Deltaproteobacteria bacterium]|nr:DUF4282 domain-containing protein [Deltaproteobacteria bacterium]